jgi:hypothetical protein
VVIGFVAAEPIETFTPGRLNNISVSVAAEADVDPSNVNVTASAASTQVNIVITTPTASVTATVEETLYQSAFADASAASSFLGVTVTSAPTIATQTIVTVIPPSMSSGLSVPDAGAGSTLTLAIAVGAGSLVGGIALIMLVICCRKRGKKTGRAGTTRGQSIRNLFGSSRARVGFGGSSRMSDERGVATSGIALEEDFDIVKAARPVRDLGAERTIDSVKKDKACAVSPPQLRPVVDGPVVGVPVVGDSLEEALEWFRRNWPVATPSPLTTPRAACLPPGVAIISRNRNAPTGAPGFAPHFQIPSVPGRPVHTPQAPSMGVVGARRPQLGGAPQAMLNTVSPKPKVQKELGINATEKRIDDRLDERMDNDGQRSFRSSQGRSLQAKKGKAKETRKMAHGTEVMSSDRSYGRPYSGNRPVASEHALGHPSGTTSRSSTLSSSTSRSSTSESAQTLVGFEVGTTFDA